MLRRPFSRGAPSWKGARVSLSVTPCSSAATSWTGAAIALLKGWTVLIPFVAFTAFVTLLTRSTAAGMAIAIGYRLAEGLIVTILGAVFTWFGTLSRYLLGQNIDAWAGLSFLGGGQARTDAARVALVLLVYTAALVAASLFLFDARDVTSASSG